MIDLFRKTCNELKENLPAIAVSSTGVGFLTMRVLTNCVEQRANYTVMEEKVGSIQLPITGIGQTKPFELFVPSANSHRSMTGLRAEG